MTETYSIIFPSVLKRLDYDRKLGPSDKKRVQLSLDEAFALLDRYCRDMYQGVDFDIAIREDWNVSNPDTLSDRNLKTAKLLNAQGFSNADLGDLLNRSLPPLSAIPPDADIFASDAYDRPAAEAMAWLDGYKGINAANASKILHQKRPGMFPILDQLTRRAMGLAWVDGEDASAYVAILRRYRELWTVHNGSSVSPLMEGVRTRGPSALAGKSRVRVLDVLAWSLIVFRDPFKGERTA